MRGTATAAVLPTFGQRLAAWLLAGAAAGVLLAWLAVSLVHVDDRERVGHVQGAWMALARSANEGTLYPPVFDGERYGGTRWMPLGIVTHALAARLVGSELVGGKTLALLAGLALLGVAAAVLRRLGCPWPLAAGLLAPVLVTAAGLFTTTTIGGDVLALVLQLAGVLLFLRWEAVTAPALDRGADVGGRVTANAEAGVGPAGTRVLLAAGLLAGLAPLAKLTAGWAVLAILCRLVTARRWRDLGVFLGAAAGTAVAGSGVALAASEGRLWDSVGRFAFAGGGVDLEGLARAPNQVVYNLAEFAPGMLAVVPLAAGAVLLVRRWSDLSVVDWALAWAVVALLVVFTDIGTGLNQLIDVLVLLVLVAAQLPGRLAGGWGERGARLGAGALGAAACTALVVGVVIALVPALRTAVEVARQGHPLPTVPLQDVLDPGDTLLSEDPFVPVAHGREPVVLDPFMVRRLDEVDPAAVDPLIERIERGAFDYVLLLEDLDDRPDWWEDYHFGPRVADALRGAYEPAAERDGYGVYRPKR